MEDQLLEFLKRDIDNLRADVKFDLKEINSKLDEVLAFRWKIIGGSVVISGFLSVAVSIVLAIIQSK